MGLNSRKKESEYIDNQELHSNNSRSEKRMGRNNFGPTG
jgi:hypothetical protein